MLDADLFSKLSDIATDLTEGLALEVKAWKEKIRHAEERSHPEPSSGSQEAETRYPELVSGSQEVLLNTQESGTRHAELDSASPEILKRVQDDSYSGVQHDEYHSCETLKQVHDDKKQVRDAGKCPIQKFSTLVESIMRLHRLSKMEAGQQPIPSKEEDLEIMENYYQKRKAKEEGNCHPELGSGSQESETRHPETSSGSQEILLNTQESGTRHAELDSASPEILKRVQDDGYSGVQHDINTTQGDGVPPLNPIIRRDFPAFLHKAFNTVNPGTDYQPNWHIDLLAEHLEAVEKGEIKRLIINIPPRSLKSICVSVAWPAWLLGHDPSKRIMAASYSQTLSTKHSLDTRFILESGWYKQAFPAANLSKSHNRKSKFLTTSNGFRFATSVGGSATGEGGDFLIIDDPHNPSHINSLKRRKMAIEWFENSFASRLNDKNKGAIILVMQRLHEDDLSGHLLAAGGWQHLKIPVRACENIVYRMNSGKYFFAAEQTLHVKRDSEENLLKLEKELGSCNYAAQYMQEPVTQNYALLTESDISYYDILPENFEYYIQSWDTAIKTSQQSDYSVGTCWGIVGQTYYLLGMIRAKFFYPELKNRIEKMAAGYRPRALLIEDKASGQQIIQDLKFSGFNNIVPVKPRLDKVSRFASVVALFQSGRVLLPRKSSFNAALLRELTAFPHCRYDDIIDSISQFLNYIKASIDGNRINIRSL